MTRMMPLFVLWLASRFVTLAAGTLPEKGKEDAGGGEKQARALYQEAVRACDKNDLKGCLELLRRAIAACDAAIVWANDDKAEHFARLMLLDEESPVRREFLELIDLANCDKELRASIKSKCQQAAKEGKRVLLDFYGEW